MTFYPQVQVSGLTARRLALWLAYTSRWPAEAANEIGQKAPERKDLACPPQLRGSE